MDPELVSPPWPRWIRRKGDPPFPESTSVGSPRGDAARASQFIESGIAAEAKGDAPEAERLFRQAVEADPASALACMNLGIVLHGKGDLAAAAAEHAKAVQLDPALASAHYNFALALLDMDERSAAESEFREAVRLRHEFPEAWVGLADVLESAGRYDEALAALDCAISQRPGYVGALFNSGLLLRTTGRLDEAEARLAAVPEDHPDYPNAITALAAILRDKGRVEEAIALVRAATGRRPDSPATLSEYLLTLGFSDRISAEQLFAEHFWAGCRMEAWTPLWRPQLSKFPDPDRRLRIGYLSGDFQGHAVAVFTEFLFEHHRRDRVQVHAYSSTPVPDAMTARFAAAADVWRDVRSQSDAALAETILGDGIDVLVDLSGHTNNGRLGVMAGRAAPVQMTWLGYISTTGLTRIDYRISDPVADPPELADRLHTERLLRMPHSQWCFRPPPAVRDLGVEREAASDTFTFGSFNQYAKVSEATVALWIASLHAAPDARLRAVGVPRGSAREVLGGKLAEAGIPSSRYDFVERVPLRAYFSEYRRVDACLDTTPYSGGTTTCDALWMGVPVLTLSGSRSMSRSSASLLAAAGLSRLTASTPDQFAAIAKSVAAQGPWTSAARKALRNQFLQSPLSDEQGFTYALEDLYRAAWREWCGLQRK
jgi:protein O-GlcNAc transferase